MGNQNRNHMDVKQEDTCDWMLNQIEHNLIGFTIFLNGLVTNKYVVGRFVGKEDLFGW